MTKPFLLPLVAAFALALPAAALAQYTNSMGGTFNNGASAYASSKVIDRIIARRHKAALARRAKTRKATEGDRQVTETRPFPFANEGLTKRRLAGTASDPKGQEARVCVHPHSPQPSRD